MVEIPDIDSDLPDVERELERLARERKDPNARNDPPRPEVVLSPRKKRRFFDFVDVNLL